MGTKRRKRKLKQNSPKSRMATQPVVVEGHRAKLASPVQVQIEIEDSEFETYGTGGSESEGVEIEVARIEVPRIEVPHIGVPHIGKSESPGAVLVEIEEPAANAATAPNNGKPALQFIVPAGAERRAYPRYAFTAAIDVAGAEADAQLRTRIRDLSQQGCYVDTDRPLALGTHTEVRITKGTKSLHAHTRVVYNQVGKGMGLMFTSVPPEQQDILDLWLAESREISWLAANRRRSQRVLMKIPVRVASHPGAALRFEEVTHTVAISAHGASILVATPIERGQRFALSNLKTKATLECIVVHVERVAGERAQAGVEFMLPNPTFWRVAFPPKDWTRHHPDAKS
jgi:PilZ domain-containing protein